MNMMSRPDTLANVNDGAVQSAPISAIPQYLHLLAQHRDLLLIWAGREVKVRYKQSILGGLWAILQPLSQMIIFTVVFSLFIRAPSDDLPYPVFSYLTLLFWTFLANSINFGVPSLVNNMNLVTKIYFPREILPISAILAGLVDLGVAALVFVGLLIAYRIPFHPTVLWVPVLLAVQIGLTLAITLFASAVNVFFRDVRFIVPLGLQLWMYASPVIYSISLIPDRYRALYMLNPMAAILDGYRRAILMGQAPDLAALGVGSVASGILLALAYLFFKHVEWQFADIV